jgi:DNA polymerase III epsilon subunit-like protein
MVVVDVEATGTDYATHSIASIGALDFQAPDNRFYIECRVWDGAHIMDEALAVCGFSREEVMDPNKPSEGEAVDAFLSWIRHCDERTLVGQNVSFDRDFLKAAAHRQHLNWELAHRTIDTHTLAYMHHIKRGIEPPVEHHRSALDLDAILNYVGIPEEPQPHNALTGALSHAEVTARLLYDRPLLEEFRQFAIPWQTV